MRLCIHLAGCPPMSRVGKYGIFAAWGHGQVNSNRETYNGYGHSRFVRMREGWT
ncbi:hypothetical protein BCM02_101599 [Paenibacillus methanolicus]|uniref:Uncharacterized protein n=1 Tax=Paenibacillus methanolicus TaxID=582686 RepID=A0A5S5CLU3_9BACL|nr:hypothetical protein BCM02_101599 [Paenibacillus methanolicus]